MGNIQSGNAGTSPMLIPTLNRVIIHCTDSIADDAICEDQSGSIVRFWEAGYCWRIPSPAISMTSNQGIQADVKSVKINPLVEPKRIESVCARSKNVSDIARCECRNRTSRP